MIKSYSIKVNGNVYEVEVEELGVSQSQVARPQTAQAPQPKAQTAQAPQVKASAPVQGGSENVIAPMPGTISDIKVSVGQDVKKGQVLLILEAMKMENEIMASCDGKVSVINTSKGASVSSGDILITLG